MVSWSSSPGDLTYTWCPLLSVTLEKETQMCRGVVGQPNLPQSGVWSGKLSEGKTLQTIGTSSPLCTLDRGFYLILDLFRLTRCLSVQKGDEAIFSGFLRCHSEIAHFLWHWIMRTEALLGALGCTPSWWASEPSIGSSPVDCEENLPTTVWLA